jgi:acid phosphatase type 7
MKNLLLTLLCLPIIGLSQNFTIQPYLQNASPNSITIMWEYSNWDISFVEWGNTTALGNIDTTTFEITSSPSCVFTAKLIGLQANTKYYYQVISGNSTSIMFDFYTPANNADEKSINIVAMSDMQTDGNNPTKFTEIINDGIIDYVQNNYGGNTNENLDMILIPGDLVNTGANYSHWKDEFFAQSEPLFSTVPFYPVLGNHEQNANLYFQYVDLQENGTPGYEEHWWYKDNSNVRVIGLNSNGPYQIQEQLDWLDSILTITASDNTIDFVFAELHHPHKSELWTPGNTSFTGDVISLLENFTSSSGKPTVHFYGHTHGYSRGQSKDHTHLMVNVATAGGYIDYWGAYPQADYEEYTMTQDEWGYVFLEVDAGNNPKFTLKRLSVGDDVISKTNSLEDSVTIRLNNSSPNIPLGIFPTSSDTVNPSCLILLADDFIDQDGDLHGASQWQISNTCNDFTAPVFDSWKQYENWYFDINTQVNDVLTDELVTNLNGSTNYCWRVRYRDRSLAWSNWSTPISFRTDSLLLTTNLLENIGAEDSINFWTVESGVLESLSSMQCNGVAPYAGQKYFSVGGLCVESSFGAASQTIDVSNYNIEIDAGVTEAIYGAHMSDYSGSDVPSIALQFLDDNNNLIFGTDTSSFTQPVWTLVDNHWAIPTGTRFIKYLIMGQRNAGQDNDSYMDDCFLKLNLDADSCSYYIDDSSSSSIDQSDLLNLKLYPNPVSDIAILNIPYSESHHISISIINIEGKKIREYNHVHPPTFILDKGDMKNGIYLMQIFNQDNIIGQIKFSVIE